MKWIHTIQWIRSDSRSIDSFGAFSLLEFQFADPIALAESSKYIKQKSVKRCDGLTRDTADIFSVFFFSILILIGKNQIRPEQTSDQNSKLKAILLPSDARVHEEFEFFAIETIILLFWFSTNRKIKTLIKSLHSAERNEGDFKLKETH